MPRIDVDKINELLINNEENNTKILCALGFDDIKRSNNELRFPREYGHNPSSCSLQLTTLKYSCFSMDKHTNLHGLVMERLHMSFPEALRWEAGQLGLSENIEVNLWDQIPYGRYWAKYKRDLSQDAVEVLDNKINDSYIGRYNQLFLRDGISFESQDKFGVGYDFETNRITVPEYTRMGELCGIMGRSNDLECDKKDRWYPIISCQRSKLLYGYHINYGSIQQNSSCIIGESEKFVQQLDSMGIHTGLATCGCNISESQAKQLYTLFLDEIVLAYDEGLTEEQIRKEAEKIKKAYGLFQVKIGYIFDKEHEVLKSGSKDSPSDHGKRSLEYLKKNAIVWI